MKIFLFFVGMIICNAQEFNDMVFEINETDAKIFKLKDYHLKKDVTNFFLTGDIIFVKSRNNSFQIAYFKGIGSFGFMPPTQTEKEQLKRFYQTDRIAESFDEMMFVSLDSSFAEFSLMQSSTLSASEMISEMKSIYTKFKQSFHHQSFLKDFLENNQNGSFASIINTKKNGALYFDIFQSEDEEIRLSKLRTYGMLLGSGFAWTETINQFHKKSDYDNYIEPNSELTGKPVIIENYNIDAKIDNNYELMAKTKIKFLPSYKQKWFSLDLYWKVEIDSVIDSKNRSLNIYRNDEFSTFWFELVDETSEPFELTFYYSGEALRRFGDYIYLWNSKGWYPRLEYRNYAAFDIKYTIPNDHFFASIGDMISLSKEDDFSKFHFRTKTKIRNASFNIGVYKTHIIDDPRIPKINLSSGRSSAQNMKNNVAPDIANSFNFFTMIYGDLPQYSEFNATEIPMGHGEAFPGLIHLSYGTFGTNLENGSHEIFRAHEVAHQWWGIGVDFKTYHDQWLSEGFSDFSGLWYMQLIMKDNEKFLDALKRYKKRIQEEKLDLKSGAKLAPISLGYRASNSETGNDYATLIYEKGAYVLQMIRMMMIDYKTFKEDRFSAMIKEFFTTYNGKKASTSDFKKIVSKHSGEDMSWFFNQWVDGSDIPEYTWAFKSANTPDGYDVQLKVRQDNVPEGFKMIVPIQVNFGNNRFFRTKILIDKRINEIALPYLPLEPESIEFNIYEAVLCEHDEDDWDDIK